MRMTSDRANRPRQSLNPYMVLALVAFGVFIAADDLTVVSTMLVQMLKDLDISVQTQLDEAAWIVNGYLIAYVVTMPFMGRVSDIFGRRLVFVGCLFVFAVGSVFVVLAPSLPWMVAARAVTAIGGGAMVPVAIAIVGDVFPERRRPFAMGILGAVDTAGWIWGPLYGAMMVRYLNWRWQFYLNLPLSGLAAAAAFYALRDTQVHLEQGKQDRRLDLLGAGLLTVALLVFGVHVRGSLVLLYGLTGIYLFGNMGIALIVSSSAKTQQQALLTSFLILMPSVMLTTERVVPLAVSSSRAS